MNHIRNGVKNARSLLQEGNARAALELCEETAQHLHEVQDPPDEQKNQVICALMLTMGAAAANLELWDKGIFSYEKAVALQPTIPQGWKGLVDCLTSVGREKELAEPLTKLAIIMQSKKNWPRAKSLILRALSLLMEKGFGTKLEARNVLELHISNLESTQSAMESPQEQYEFNVRSAILAEPASAKCSKYFSQILEQKIFIKQYLKEDLTEMLVDAFTSHYLTSIEIAKNEKEKVILWNHFINECYALFLLLDRHSSLRDNILLASWYVDINKISSNISLVDLASIGDAPSSNFECLIYKAYMAYSAERLYEVEELLKNIENIPISLRALDDWRYKSLAVLVKKDQKNDSDEEKEHGLALVENAISSIETSSVDGYGPPLSSRDLLSDLMVVKAHCLASMGHQKDSLTILKEYLECNEKVNELCAAKIHTELGAIYFQCQDLEISKMHLNMALQSVSRYPAALEMLGDLMMSTDNPNEALPYYQEICDFVAAESEKKKQSAIFLKLGRCKWMCGGDYKTQREECFSAFLKAAQLDPTSSKSFEMLGQWYDEVAHDEARAAGCFGRALKLDPNNAVAGLKAISLHVESGDNEKAMDLCKVAVQNSSNSAWAWAHMGRSSMIKDDLDEAISFLQQALSGTPCDWTLWGDLGWLYYRQEKHQAAMKAYCRAISIVKDEMSGPESIHCSSSELSRLLTDLSIIQQEIKLIDEANKSIQKALELTPNDPLTILRCGQIALSESQARISEGLYTAASNAIMNGVAYVTKYLCVEENKVGFKLLGDLKVCAQRIPPQFFDDSVNSIIEFIGEAVDAYREVLKFFSEADEDSEKSAAHYDLALAYLLLAKVIRLDLGEGSGLWPSSTYLANEAVHKLISNAREELRVSLQLDPLQSDAWSALGTIEDDPLVQQHCFARAVEIDHNPSAWANLAALYLNVGRDGEAYESLDALQTIIDHPVLWVILGMLKEKEALVKLKEENDKDGDRKRALFYFSQAADSYYSSLETTSLLDALFGLSRSASFTHSLPDAVTAACQLCQIAPKNPAAWNLYGSLLEASNRFESALDAFCSSRKLIEEQTNINGASSTASQAISTVKRSILRCHITLGMDEALQEIDEYDAADPATVLLKAKALASVGKYKETLKLLEDPKNLSELMLAASAAYFAKQYETSRYLGSLLLKHYNLHTSAVLIALCISSTCKDSLLFTESEQFFSKLFQSEKSVVLDEDIITYYSLKCAASLKDKPSDLVAASEKLCSAIHMFPDNVELWTEYASLHLEHGLKMGKRGLKSFIRAKDCANTAIKIVDSCNQNTCIRDGKRRTQVKAHLHARALAIRSCTDIALGDPTLSLHHRRASDGFRDAAIAVHLYPDDSQLFRILKLSLIFHARMNNTFEKYERVLNILSSAYPELPQALEGSCTGADASTHWFQKSNRYRSQGNTSAAKEALLEALNHYPDEKNQINILLAELVASTESYDSSLVILKRSFSDGEFIIADFLRGVLLKRSGEESQASLAFNWVAANATESEKRIHKTVLKQFLQIEASEQQAPANEVEAYGN